MATQHTDQIALPYWQKGDRDWHVQFAEACELLDALAAIGSLAVATTEIPSTTLNVKVSAGTFRQSDGTLASYAGTASQALAASQTNYIYLTNAGTLTVNTTGFPADTFHVRLAIATTNASTVTAIQDARLFAFSTGKLRVASANQAALTNSTGGTTGTILAAVGATNSSDVSGTINNNFTRIFTLLDAIRSALVAADIMKGSA